MSFHDPWLLALALLIPLQVYLALKPRSRPALAFSAAWLIGRVRPTWRLHFAKYAFTLRSLALALFVVGLARPQVLLPESRARVYGIDIMLVIDVSTSMRAEDLAPGKNRLTAAKEVVRDFVSRRADDRIGMVVFAGRPYTQAPLTLDYNVIIEMLDWLETGMVEDGTAIGMALGTAVNRLRESEAKAKVVILLTDGRNNMGEIGPETAAQAARSMNVRVYTVGVGTRGRAPYPVVDALGRKRYVYQQAEVDDASLAEIAQVTGGRYFRATDSESLEETYREIDRLEKSELPAKRQGRFKELFPLFVLPAVGLLLAELLLAATWLRRTP